MNDHNKGDLVWCKVAITNSYTHSILLKYRGVSPDYDYNELSEFKDLYTSAANDDIIIQDWMGVDDGHYSLLNIHD